MYKADKSLVKHYTREILKQEVLSTWGKFYNTKDVLTLSNKNFEIESALKAQFSYRARITCIEYDKKVYEQALKTKPNGINLVYGDIFKYKLPQSNNLRGYDFVWMDLCNSFSDDVIMNVIEFIKKSKFNENSIFALTLNKRRGSINKSIINNYYNRYKQKGIVTHIGNFFKNEVLEVKRMDYICFDISNKGSAMVVYIFKLGKQL